MGRAALALTVADVFFYGTLCHLPLLRAVLGRDDARAAPAVLDGFAVYWARDQAFPLIFEQPGAQAQGVLVRGMSADDIARLDFYAGGFAGRTRDLDVMAADGRVVARVYFADHAGLEAGPSWRLEDWQAGFGDTVVATAGDVMALFGQHPPQSVRARYGQMLVRGSSRVRAAKAAPTTLRRRAVPGDVAVAKRSLPYANFFAVEEYDLQFRRFDGTLSRVVNRAAFISGDAVTVLPYDPVRDRVLLIEQFRVAPFARGDAQCWLLEAIAGRIDPHETPEQAARREAVEEAGLTLGDLLPVADYYPSPGAKAEYLYSYVAICDLPDDAAGVFGVAHEAEDIRGHLIGFDAMMALVDSGEINNAPLIMTALWLARARDGLRGH